MVDVCHPVWSSFYSVISWLVGCPILQGRGKLSVNFTQELANKISILTSLVFYQLRVII